MEVKNQFIKNQFDFSNFQELKKVIDKIKNTPLSGDDLQMICPAPIILIRDLPKIAEAAKVRNIDPITAMLGKGKCCYLLYEWKNHVGHWCALTLSGNILEFFDPYGKTIDSQIEFIPPKFAAETGQDKKLLTRLMIDCPYELSYNEFGFQAWKKNIKNCGLWSGFRCLLKDMPLEQFNTLFLENYDKGASDDLIAFAAAVLLGKGH